MENDKKLSDEAKEKMRKIVADTPDRKKHVKRLFRLLNLARTAPTADANEDFLDIMHIEFKKMEGEVELAEMLTKIMTDVETKEPR